MDEQEREIHDKIDTELKKLKEAKAKAKARADHFGFRRPSRRISEAGRCATATQ